MKNIMTTVLVAGGLMLMSSPEAAAHKEVRHTYQPPAYYHPDSSYRRGADIYRARHMPRWLKHNESFRWWYRHSPLKHNRRIDWNQLFDIYRWEHRHRYDRRYRDYEHYRHRDDRHGHRKGRRHRH